MTSDAWTQASDPSARGSRDPSFGGQEEPLSYVLQSQGQAVGAESLGRGEPTARLAARPSCGLHWGGGSPAGDALLLECFGRSWFAWLRRLRAPRPACRLRWEPGEPVAKVTWRINCRTWRRRLPRPLPCPARGICLRPRLCPQCKRSEGLGLADLHSCPSRGPSAPPRSHSSGGRGVASLLGLEALQGPPGGTRILFSLVPVLRPLDCFHNFPQKFAPKQSPRKSAQTSFQSV